MQKLSDEEKLIVKNSVRSEIYDTTGKSKYISFISPDGNRLYIDVSDYEFRLLLSWCMWGVYLDDSTDGGSILHSTIVREVLIMAQGEEEK